MLKKLKVETEMSKTYIDDKTVAMKSLDAGVRFGAERMKMVVVPEFVESDKEIPEDKRTMIELNKIANTIYECVQFTTDCPSNHQEGEGKMPVLDTKMYVEGNAIRYEFYEKTLCLRAGHPSEFCPQQANEAFCDGGGRNEKA